MHSSQRPTHDSSGSNRVATLVSSRSTASMIVLLCSAVTIVVGGNLAQAGLDFSSWGGFSRVAWAYALMDGGGGGGFFQFNIFVAPFVLALATSLLCVSSVTPTTARRLGRWLLVLNTFALLQTPLPVLGRVLFQSLVSSRIGWSEPRLVFLGVLSFLRLIACVGVLLGVSKFWAHQSDSDLEVNDDSQARRDRTLALRTPTARTTHLAPLLMGLAAVAGLSIGIVTAIYRLDVVAVFNWQYLKYIATDLATITSSDLTAMAVPCLLLVTVMILWRTPHLKAVRDGARFLTAFAAFEILLMPTFIVVMIQNNVDTDAVGFVDLATWFAARALVCVAAFVGAVGLLRQRSVDQSPVSAGQEERVGEVSNDTSLRPESFAPSTPPSATSTLVTGRQAMSSIFGVAASASAVAGVLVAVYDYVRPHDAIIGWGNGPLGSDVLGGALRQVATGQGGDFLFLFGPLMLVLAIYVREPGVADVPREQMVKRWLMSVAIVQGIATCLYVAVVGWTTRIGAVSILGWPLVRVLVCSTVLAYAVGVARTTDGTKRHHKTTPTVTLERATEH